MHTLQLGFDLNRLLPNGINGVIPLLALIVLAGVVFLTRRRTDRISKLLQQLPKVSPEDATGLIYAEMGSIGTPKDVPPEVALRQMRQRYVRDGVIVGIVTVALTVIILVWINVSRTAEEFKDPKLLEKQFDQTFRNANSQIQSGQLNDARKTLADARKIAEQITERDGGKPYSLGFAVIEDGLGLCAEYSNDFEEALDHEKKAQVHLAGLHDLLKAQNFLAQGNTLVSLKRWQPANEAYELARDCLKTPYPDDMEAERQRLLQYVQVGRERSEIEKGNLTELQIDNLAQRIEISISKGQTEAAASRLHNLAKVCYYRGLKEARKYVERAKEINSRQGGDQKFLATNYQLLAAIDAREKKLPSAIENSTKALRFARTQKNAKLAVDCFEVLAEVDLQKKSNDFGFKYIVVIEETMSHGLKRSPQDQKGYEQLAETIKSKLSSKQKDAITQSYSSINWLALATEVTSKEPIDP